MCVCVSTAALTCDDDVALVVEGAGEDLVAVAPQDLQADSGASVPQTGRLVRAGRQDSSALRTEADLQPQAGDKPQRERMNLIYFASFQMTK